MDHLHVPPHHLQKGKVKSLQSPFSLSLIIKCIMLFKGGVCDMLKLYILQVIFCLHYSDLSPLWHCSGRTGIPAGRGLSAVILVVRVVHALFRGVWAAHGANLSVGVVLRSTVTIVFMLPLKGKESFHLKKFQSSERAGWFGAQAHSLGSSHW